MITFSADVARSRIDDLLRQAEAARAAGAARRPATGDDGAPTPAERTERRFVLPEAVVAERAGAR